MAPKGLISFLFGVVALLIWFCWPGKEPGVTALKLSLGWLGVGAIEFCTYLYENRKRLSILQTQWFKRNHPIRATVAYLFRIECNGKYLLIKRHKNDNKGYQPVGGTYKYFKEENRKLFDDLGIEPCNNVQRDEDTENDLRIIINKRKKLLDFLKWFSSRKDREVDPLREFFEEMIVPGHVNEKKFRHIKYIFIRKHEEYVSPSPVYKVDEFRYADIYELRLETDEQKKEIRDLVGKSDEIIFATADEIRKGMTNSGQIILPHTFKILPKC
ncbi:MAG: hypothetical protein ABI480_01775 [Chitinophagaceae bacterium]